MPGEMPGETLNNPFKNVEEMEVEITDNSRTPKKREEDPWKKDKKTFEKFARLGNLDMGSFKEKGLRGKGKLQFEQCEVPECPTGKVEEMGYRCSVCDKRKFGKIRNIGGNMPEGPEKIIEPKDEEDNPVAS